ncbi:hypothetical protein [Alkalihalobacillus sp. TS-13]|uniref:hypothetical protein n=1 Tax=Alkalihalobacillus sp. TS-13 TaxID=2842455 RepID=UPI001C8693F8|nr:hypothetical protein [Alkalihalobacillus sp. TS-13]
MQIGTTSQVKWKAKSSIKIPAGVSQISLKKKFLKALFVKIVVFLGLRNTRFPLAIRKPSHLHRMRWLRRLPQDVVVFSRRSF